jgi:general secretion pathway protein K
MKHKRAQTEQKGFILVVVLSMVTMLSVLLLGFNYRSRVNLRTMDDFQKSLQALNCAKAGLNIAMAAIRDTNDICTNKTLLNLLSGENTFELDDGKCSITVTEENGKLNVNQLRDQSGQLNRTAIERLLRLIDRLNQERASQSYIGYGMVPSIIDWTDNDDQVTYLPFVKHENSGAESSYYGGLKTPYKCKNATLDTTEELLLVKGVTSETFERMRDYITVHGDGKININYASKYVIESLSEKMDAALAQIIIDQRKSDPFESITELRDVTGMTDSIYDTIKKDVTVNPTEQYYNVTSQGNVDHLSRKTAAVLRRNMKTKEVEVILYKEL